MRSAFPLERFEPTFDRASAFVGHVYHATRRFADFVSIDVVLREPSSHASQVSDRIQAPAAYVNGRPSDFAPGPVGQLSFLHG
jgi:hypothetical protein